MASAVLVDDLSHLPSASDDAIDRHNHLVLRSRFPVGTGGRGSRSRSCTPALQLRWQQGSGSHVLAAYGGRHRCCQRDIQAEIEVAAAARDVGASTLMRQIIEEWVAAHRDSVAPDQLGELVRHLDAARRAAASLARPAA